MKIINVTPEIGFTIKNLRLKYGVTAVSVAELFDKAPSYISKLEKGDVKKIDIDFFVSILNFITDSSKGLIIFLDSITENMESLDVATIKTIMDLDDVVYKLEINPLLLEHINKLIDENKLTIEVICNEINKNQDLKRLSTDIYEKLPINEWFFIDDKINDGVIRLNYPMETILNIISGNVTSVNFLTLEAILYTIYKLIGEEKKSARLHTFSTLHSFKMLNSRAKHIKSKTIDIDKDFATLDPANVALYQVIMNQLKIMLIMNEKYSEKRFSNLKENLKNDLGFTFAFITTDLSDILDLSKDTKQNFLNDLRNLIDEYSQPAQQTLDLYLDE